jgi:hypothetical protein
MQHPIVTAARRHIGTRFHHQGRLAKTEKHKGGLDCLGLLVCVADELQLRGKNGDLLVSFDARDYPHHPDTEELQRRLMRLLQKVGDMQEGDIALFNIDGAPQHMGIISYNVIPTKAEESSISLDCARDDTPGFSLIHAYAPARAVVEHALDAYWQSKIVAVYRLTSWPA